MNLSKYLCSDCIWAETGCEDEHICEHYSPEDDQDIRYTEDIGKTLFRHEWFDYISEWN